jgi:uncharacterized protein (TIGR00369 family)
MVCGASNPHGMGITWLDAGDGRILADFVLDEKFQGPRAHVHGGASAAILDEAIGVAIWRAGYNVAVVHLSVTYRKALPLGVPLHLEAQMTHKQGRKLYGQGKIALPDGQIAVEAEGIYVEAPHLFEENRYRQ